MRFDKTKLSVNGVELIGFDDGEVEFHRPAENPFILVHLKRDVRLQPGDMVYESMIERRRWVLAGRRARDAVKKAWFGLRMWWANR